MKKQAVYSSLIVLSLVIVLVYSSWTSIDIKTRTIEAAPISIKAVYLSSDFASYTKDTQKFRIIDSLRLLAMAEDTKSVYEKDFRKKIKACINHPCLYLKVSLHQE